MDIHSAHHLRIARPALDLAASERFYAGGLGLAVLFRVTGRPASEERDLLMVGPAGGHWHLELTASDTDPVEPAPTPEDLLVFYLGDEYDAEAGRQLRERLPEHGGTPVVSHNPYWDQHGATFEDPDGYRVVLTSRMWAPE
jgi:catechol 2,3-dioxygenase-like lactoylglutathione lyase family enzyme